MTLVIEFIFFILNYISDISDCMSCFKNLFCEIELKLKIYLK